MLVGRHHHTVFGLAPMRRARDEVCEHVIMKAVLPGAITGSEEVDKAGTEPSKDVTSGEVQHQPGS